MYEKDIDCFDCYYINLWNIIVRIMFPKYTKTKYTGN